MRHVLLLNDALLVPAAVPLREIYEIVQMWDEGREAFLAGPAKRVEAILYAGAPNVDCGLIEGMPNLKVIGCVGVGYDGLDVAWCRSRGVEVTHAYGLNTDDVADGALALMLASWRGVLIADHYIRSGAWARRETRPSFSSLTGRRVGIVGLGAIGSEIARRVQALKMQVSWWGPRDKAGPLPKAETLLALAEQSDILFIACRADAENRGMIDKAVIEALGPKGLLVNVSRGYVVDEEALIAALKDGRLGMAGLDVFETEPTPPERWADVPNAVFTPHFIGATTETVQRLRAQAAENIRRVLAGEPPLSPVMV